MRTVKLLLALFSVSLVMVSCYTTGGLSSGDEPQGTTRRIGNHVYVDDPYYGQVILEQNPYTGRYHDVTYGGINGWGSPYNRFGGYPANRGRYYGNRPIIVRPQTSRPLPPPQRAIPQRSAPQREQARKAILGNR